MTILSILGSRLAGYVGIAAAVVLSIALVRAQFQIGYRDGEIMMYREVIEGPEGYIARSAVLAASNKILEDARKALSAEIDRSNMKLQLLVDIGNADTARGNRILAEVRGTSAMTVMLADMIDASILMRRPFAGEDVCAVAFVEGKRPNQQ